MNAHSVQAPVLQRLAADEQPRRRSVPPSSSVLVSQSVNQRWRERPRCPARRVTPGRRDGSFTPSLVVPHVNVYPHTSCRTNAPPVPHAFVSRFAGTMRLANGTEISSCASHLFPERRHVCRSRFRHRTIALIMLAPCSASSMLFASHRPGLAAGPSGIDDACARHDLGYCAMAGFLMTRAGREKRVDAGFPQAYLDVSRLCPPAHPPHRTQCMQSAFSSRRPQGTIQAPPHNIASGCYVVTLRVRRRT